MFDALFTTVVPLDPSMVFNWGQLVAYGPLGVMFGLMVWFALQYGSRVIESHLRFQDAVTLLMPRAVAALELLASLKGDGVDHRP